MKTLRTNFGSPKVSPGVKGKCELKVFLTRNKSKSQYNALKDQQVEIRSRMKPLGFTMWATGNHYTHSADWATFLSR